jgi:hypothetical protein
MAHIESYEAAKSHIASIRESKGLIEGKKMNDNCQLEYQLITCF